MNDAKSSIGYWQRELGSAQAQEKFEKGVNDGLASVQLNTYKKEIKSIQGMLDDSYKELEEVGNNNTHLEFKRYKDKCNSGVKDAQDNIQRLQEQLHIEESRLEWSAIVYSIGGVILSDHPENARMIQLDQNLLDDT